MKLKYYLRGLGVGIAVTTVFLSVYLAGQNKLSDEEIISRAKKLGMIESTVLKPASGDNTPEVTPDTNDMHGEDSGIEDAPVVDPSTDDAPVVEPDTDDVPVVEPDADDVPIVAPDGDNVDVTNPDTDTSPQTPTTDQDTDAEYITFTIQRGEASNKVAKRLEELEIVDDAAAFDRFLSTNGYDKRIQTGVHQVPVGASYEEVAASII